MEAATMEAYKKFITQTQTQNVLCTNSSLARGLLKKQAKSVFQTIFRKESLWNTDHQRWNKHHHSGHRRMVKEWRNGRAVSFGAKNRYYMPVKILMS